MANLAMTDFWTGQEVLFWHYALSTSNYWWLFWLVVAIRTVYWMGIVPGPTDLIHANYADGAAPHDARDPREGRRDDPFGGHLPHYAAHDLCELALEKSVDYPFLPVFLGNLGTRCCVSISWRRLICY